MILKRISVAGRSKNIAQRKRHHPHNTTFYRWNAAEQLYDFCIQIHGYDGEVYEVQADQGEWETVMAHLRERFEEVPG